ncbi:hypothetical protein CYMTET_52572 [Cymbomonas tetramitiformis]|uniref:Uncharacterized protein n=1 Tax=Cymbomonas tetramitiformis TaxID=36881 RepID=A0AAE0BKG5_9CHLO|nr:hypothetical protein CYMTET_52572 [Cymbomonas tetramitiformis]
MKDFDQETHELQARLLAKYSKIKEEGDDARGQIDEDAIARGQRMADKQQLEDMRKAREAGNFEEAPSKTSSVSIVCCKQCQGSGSFKEYYNNREMQVHCTICDGEGVIRTGEPGVKKPSVAASLNASKVSASGEEIDLKKLLGKKQQKLETAIQKYRPQIASCTEELAQLTHRQKNTPDDQEATLIGDLIGKLKRHMDTLGDKLHSKKEALEALEHLRTPGVLTSYKQVVGRDESVPA